MWYRLIQAENKFKEGGAFDAKIVDFLAENAVRHFLFLKGDYHPDNKLINRYKNLAINTLRNEYHKLSLIRRTVPGDHLKDVVYNTVDKIINKKKK